MELYPKLGTLENFNGISTVAKWDKVAKVVDLLLTTFGNGGRGQVLSTILYPWNGLR